MKALPSGIGEHKHLKTTFRKKSYQNVICGAGECNYTKSTELETLPSGTPAAYCAERIGSYSGLPVALGSRTPLPWRCNFLRFVGQL